MSKKSSRASLSESNPFDETDGVVFDPLDLVVPTKSKDEIERSSGKRYKRKGGAQETRQASVQLYEYQLDWIEDTLRTIKKSGGRSITKTNLIRALVQISIDSGVKLRGVSNEDELISRLKEELSQ